MKWKIMVIDEISIYSCASHIPSKSLQILSYPYGIPKWLPSAGGPKRPLPGTLGKPGRIIGTILTLTDFWATSSACRAVTAPLLRRPTARTLRHSPQNCQHSDPPIALIWEFPPNFKIFLIKNVKKPPSLSIRICAQCGIWTVLADGFRLKAENSCIIWSHRPWRNVRPKWWWPQYSHL